MHFLLLVVFTLAAAALLGFLILQGRKHRANDDAFVDGSNALEEHSGSEAEEQEEESGDERGKKKQSRTAAAAAAGSTRRALKKAEKKRKKDDSRTAMEEALEMRRRGAEEARQKDEEQREDARRRAEAEEEALEALRREKQRTAEEEYRKWVGHISVEEQGEVGEIGSNESQFRSYVRDEAPTKEKLLVLDTASRQFSLSVEKIVSILEAMCADRTISGVFDEHGKFLFVSEAELKAVAKFMKNRGRVAVHELVRECNRLVDLSATDSGN